MELLDLVRRLPAGSARAAVEALAAVDAAGPGAPESWAAMLAHRARLIAALAGR